MEKQFASLTLAIPNTRLNEQLTPSSDKNKENMDAMDCDQQIDVPNQLPPMKQFASLTLVIPITHINKQLTPLSDKDKENIEAMDYDQQIDVPNQLPPMKPESYRYLAALSNEEYEDLLKYTASRRL